MNKIILENVREYAEEMPVELLTYNSGRKVIRAYNEGGYNYTEVDLEDLLIALIKILPNH